MLLRDNPYLAILCLTAVMSGCVAFTAWLRRDYAPATRPFTGLMVAIALNAIAAAMGKATASHQAALFWSTLEASFSSIVTGLFFIFTLHFSHQEHWLTPRRRSLIWAMPIFNVALVITNSWHHLVWTGFTPTENGQSLIFHQGIGYLWIGLCFYIYVLTGSLLVARVALNAIELYRRQAITVIVSTLPPLLCGTLHLLELVPPGISLLPMSFLLTGLIYFTSLFRFRLFDLLPIARDTLIENMTDSVLVLDNDERIIDINPAAQQLIEKITAQLSPASHPLHQYPQGGNSLLLTPLPSTPPSMYLGQPISQVLDKWPSLLRYCQRDWQKDWQIEWTDAGCGASDAEPQAENLTEKRAEKSGSDQPIDLPVSRTPKSRIPVTQTSEVLLTLCHQPPLHVNVRISELYRQPQPVRRGSKGRAKRQRSPKFAGKLIVIRDMTQFYQTQIELRQTNSIQQQTQRTLERTNEILASRLRENEALQSQLQEQAIRDGLTGLFNRRYFEEALQAEFTKARRANLPLAVILVDIDHFKRVNDTYGHQAGDCALQVFAKIILEHVRTSDIACRYGGEEFILALPGMTLAEAFQRAEKLRLAFKETEILFKKQVIQATISGGIGALPEFTGNKDAFISLIDKALYSAKAGGRDRIHLAQLNAATDLPALSQH
jgi:diguanylate cyclase (GGDEF)-like protein